MRNNEPSYTISFPEGGLALCAIMTIAVLVLATWEFWFHRIISALILVIIGLWNLRSMVRILSTNRLILHFDTAGLRTPSTGFIPWKQIRSLDLVEKVFGRFRRPFLRVIHGPSEENTTTDRVDLLYALEDENRILSIAREFWKAA